MLIGSCKRYIKGLDVDPDRKTYYYDRKSKFLITNKSECKTFVSINLNQNKMKEFFAKLWAIIVNRVFKNWKTTVAGIVGLLLGWFYFDGLITADVVGIVILLLGLLGIVVKDPRPKTK
jgi:hypothetical protein